MIDWDPIGIQTMDIFAFNVYWEYLRYIDPIIELLDQEDKLKAYIWSLAEDMTGFGKENELVAQEVNDLITRLQTIQKIDRNSAFFP
ncbi:MAG: hypothetical protein ACI9UV_001909 [Algoriphagus sp.]